MLFKKAGKSMDVEQKKSEWIAVGGSIPPAQSWGWDAPTLQGLDQTSPVHLVFVRLEHDDHISCGFDAANFSADRGAPEASRLLLLNRLIERMDRALQAMRALQDRERYGQRRERPFFHADLGPYEAHCVACGVAVSSADMDMDNFCRGCHNQARQGINPHTGERD